MKIRKKKNRKSSRLSTVFILFFILAIAAGALYIRQKNLNEKAADPAPEDEQAKAARLYKEGLNKNTELTDFLKSKKSDIVRIEEVIFTATNNTPNATAGSVITFGVEIIGQNGQGPYIKEKYSNVVIQKTAGTKQLRAQSIVLPENSNTPENIAVTVEFCGLTKSFSYKIVHQNVSNTNYGLLVNRYTKTLSSKFEPPSLVSSNGETLSKEAGNQAKKMMSDAKAEGVSFSLQSGFREYSFQVTLYQRANERHGEGQRVSAAPGTSEHQTGLAADFTAPDESGTLTVGFEKTKAFKWLSKNAHKYGFVLRYPKSMQIITEYTYEPWHYRYIGPELAKLYYEEGWLSLDEFLSIPR